MHFAKYRCIWFNSMHLAKDVDAFSKFLLVLLMRAPLLPPLRRRVSQLIRIKKWSKTWGQQPNMTGAEVSKEMDIMLKYLGINLLHSDNVVKQVVKAQPEPIKPIAANRMKSSTGEKKVKCVINRVTQRASDSAWKAWA